MTRRDFLAVSALAACTRVSARSPIPPNIVVILVDDLGWTDVACFGSGYYETPNIDRLGRKG